MIGEVKQVLKNLDCSLVLTNFQFFTFSTQLTRSHLNSHKGVRRAREAFGRYGSGETAANSLQIRGGGINTPTLLASLSGNAG
jgi:hypothetical protein